MYVTWRLVTGTDSGSTFPNVVVDGQLLVGDEVDSDLDDDSEGEEDTIDET